MLRFKDDSPTDLYNWHQKLTQKIRPTIKWTTSSQKNKCDAFETLYSGIWLSGIMCNTFNEDACSNSQNFSPTLLQLYILPLPTWLVGRGKSLNRYYQMQKTFWIHIFSNAVYTWKIHYWKAFSEKWNNRMQHFIDQFMHSKEDIHVTLQKGLYMPTNIIHRQRLAYP